MRVYMKYTAHEGMRVQRFGNVVDEVNYLVLPSYLREALHLAGPLGIHVEYDPEAGEYGAVLPVGAGFAGYGFANPQTTLSRP